MIVFESQFTNRHLIALEARDDEQYFQHQQQQQDLALQQRQRNSARVREEFLRQQRVLSGETILVHVTLPGTTNTVQETIITKLN